MNAAIIVRKAGAFLLISLATVGCSRDDLGRVRGSVTFAGKPLRAGNVNLYNADHGTGATAQLDEYGAFTVPGMLKTGEYVVYFSPPAPFMPDMEDASRPKTLKLDLSKFPNIPRRLLAQASSDYVVVVEAGQNAFQIEIPE